MAKPMREGREPTHKRMHDSIAGIARGGRPEPRTQDHYWLCLNEDCSHSRNAWKSGEKALAHEAKSEDCVVCKVDWEQGEHFPEEFIFPR